MYSPANDFSRGLHELLGMSVFGLTAMRLGWRAMFPPPQFPAMPAWMELGAKAGHWAIYALLILVPLTAIFGAWLEGHPLTLLLLETFSRCFRNRGRSASFWPMSMAGLETR